MKLKVLGFALLVTFVFSPTSIQASSTHNKKEFNIKENLKSQQILLSQKAKRKPSMAERLKVTGLKEEEVKSFLETIQKAVSKNDAVALSKIISYPIPLKLKTGRSVIINDSKQFIANYPKFVTYNWKKAVLRQKYEELFTSLQGVRIGRGEIWFSGLCKGISCIEYEIKIVGINPWFGK